MALLIHVTKADLMKNQAITPGWKEAEVQEVYAKMSKDGQSTNYWVKLAFTEDADGRNIEHNFNSKALGISLQNYCAAILGKTVLEFMESMPKETTLDLESTVGKRLMVKIKNEIFEGRPVNKVEDFCPVGKVPF